MLLSTVLNLFFIPVLYVILSRLLVAQRIASGESPADCEELATASVGER